MIADEAATTSVALPSSVVPTGNAVLDSALGGGLPTGALLLLRGETGAGATEFALALAKSAAGRAPATFATALRSPARVEREIVELFDGKPSGFAVEKIAAGDLAGDRLSHADKLAPGGLLVVESASTMLALRRTLRMPTLLRRLGDRAAEAGALVVLLHTPGSLAADVENGLEEKADGVLAFGWRDGGPTRRRILWIPRMRGFPPVLDGESVPVFELALHRGAGFSVSRVKNVL